LAALNNLNFRHAFRLPSGFGGVPYKIELFFTPPTALNLPAQP
jgi:hypothetical protein